MSGIRLQKKDGNHILKTWFAISYYIEKPDKRIVEYTKIVKVNLIVKFFSDKLKIQIRLGVILAFL
jgi:hypothetical protein